MNAIPFLLAAALTPHDQWHERWKYINRLAGIVAEWAHSRAVHFVDVQRVAQEIIDGIADDLAYFLSGREESGESVTAIRAQERELLEGLAKRVAECLMLGQCNDIESVEAALEAFRNTGGARP